MKEPSPVSAATLFSLGFFFELSLVVIATMISLVWLESPFPYTLTYDAVGLYWIIGGTLGPALFALFAASRAADRVSVLRDIYERLRDLLGPAIRDLKFEQILLLSAAAGIGEECLFRGVLEPLWGMWIVGIVFALLHYVTPAYFFFALVMSLYLSWLQQATDNLLVPMGVHWLYDAAALFLMRRRLLNDPLCG